MASGRLRGKRVSGHESFQNGQAFLEQGGQKGPQIDILLPGSYRVNTAMFQVEIDVQIATQAKQSMITSAEGEKILAIGNATAEAYVRQSAAVGQGPLAMIEVMKRVSDGKIKITPDIMVSGGGGNDGASANMLAAFMASLMGAGMRIVPQDSGLAAGRRYLTEIVRYNSSTI